MRGIEVPWLSRRLLATKVILVWARAKYLERGSVLERAHFRWDCADSLERRRGVRLRT